MKETEKIVLTDESPRPIRRAGRRIVFYSVLFAFLLAAILIATLPQFYIKQIDVTGCNEISKEELLSNSGLTVGEHLFRNLGGGIIQLFTLRYGNIEKELCNDYPYINDIKIQVVFPSKVLFTINERQKIGYAELPDGYAVIDTEGVVVELSEGAAPTGVPLMEGLPVRSSALGEKIDMTEGKGLNTCITILNAILAADENKSKNSDFSLIKCVRSVRSLEGSTTFLTLILPSTQKEFLVRIGSLKNITADMSWLRYAAEQNKFDSVGDGVLDMSGEEYTFRPVN
ncbi:MAG: hypothetical protein WCG21_05140 [Eubacteriales bacterium]